MLFSDFYHWLEDLVTKFPSFILSIFNWLNEDISLSFMFGPLGQIITLDISPLDMIFSGSIAILLTFLIIKIFA